MRTVSVLAAVAILATAALAQAPILQFAGPTAKGFLLPNGWTITPAGRQIPLTDLPLNILPSDDSKTTLVATSGFNEHELRLIEIEIKTGKGQDRRRRLPLGDLVRGERSESRIHGALHGPRLPRPRPQCRVQAARLQECKRPMAQRFADPRRQS